MTKSKKTTALADRERLRKRLAKASRAAIRQALIRALAGATEASCSMLWEGAALDTTEELRLPHWFENTRLQFNIGCELAWQSWVSESRLTKKLPKSVSADDAGTLRRLSREFDRARQRAEERQRPTRRVRGK